MDWMRLAYDVLAGGVVKPATALEILRSSDDELLAVLDAAFRIRRHRFGRGVRLHVLRNARSGGCSEDCGYCSQSAKATPGEERYPWQSCGELLAGAREAHALHAVRFCVVASGRAPTDRELDHICETVRTVKAVVPIDLCLSLGLLTPERARRLKEAGVNRYNHNLETSERYFPSLCTTHSFADRIATAKAAKAAGLELCCGGLVGAGETLEDRVELAFSLRDVRADSIPVNFLDPRPGTALASLPRIPAGDALRTLAMFRFVHPDTEIRVAGGREACLGPMQALALFAANSFFTSGYLTTGGQGYEADLRLLETAGFTVDGVAVAPPHAHGLPTE